MNTINWDLRNPTVQTHIREPPHGLQTAFIGERSLVFGGAPAECSPRRFLSSI